MTYVPPITEQRFVLEQVARISELPGHDSEIFDAVLEGAGDFAAGVYAPLNRIGDKIGARWEDGKVIMPPGFREAYRAFVDGGWGTLSVPYQFGGQGLPHVLSAVVLEDLGTANMAFSLINMLTPAAIESLLQTGSDLQRETYLPKLVTGEWNGTMLLTEPQAGSDVGALRTTATPIGNGKYKLKGTKIFVTFGEHDLTDNIVHLVLARTPGALSGTRGISLFIAPKVRADGTLNDIRSVSTEHKLGINASPTCVLSFGEDEDCIAELIGPEFGGMAAMFVLMNSARLNVGLQGVQIAERATQQAMSYARSRLQGPRAGSASREPVMIIEHPDVRRMLMRMKAQTEAARALVYYAFGQLDRGRVGDVEAQKRLELLTPLAKAHCTDLGCEVASLGVQIHGGMGYIEETGAAQHFRDARITPIYEGTNGIQAVDLVGRKLVIDNGATLIAMLDEMGRDAEEPGLAALIDASGEVARHLLDVDTDDRLAASYPFLTMLSVAVCGWLMEAQGRAAALGDGDPAFLAMKRATARFYVAQIVPEAIGLRAAATAPAAELYAFTDEAFAI